MFLTLSIDPINMEKPLDLKWSDIITETINIEQYLEKFKDKAEIKRNFDMYKPKERILKKITMIINKKGNKIRILALGADWCHDCTEQVPKMARLVHKFDSEIEMRILYGVKVNAFRREGEILWDKRHSVPEAVDPKFDVKAIPIFYFFNHEGEYLGRIIEHPKTFSSLEKDFCHIIEK